MRRSRQGSEAVAPAELLPDLCSATVTLPLVLIAALVAIALAVARSDAAGFWADLGRLALLCEFLTLISAGALCVLRRALRDAVRGFVLALAFTILIALAWGVAEAAYFLLAAYGQSPPGERLAWVARIVIVAVIVDALVLRYLYVSAEWRERVRREAASRLDALTARLRPHFLFNTLNTAAALAADKPEETERTLEDLSELVRANLAERDPLIPLNEELELLRHYLAIEARRLGERLRITWDIAAESKQALLPPMVLQPLVENAVTHGIEPSAAGGEIVIAARRVAQKLDIRITNPIAGASDEHGHGIGLAGVQARLALAFNGEATLVVQHDDDRFVAEIRCPWQTG